MDQTDDCIEKADFEIRFSDAQEIHILQDKVCQLGHVLHVNRTTFEAIGKRLGASEAARANTEEYIGRQFPELSRPYIIQTEAELQRVQSMLRRLKGASELVSTAGMRLRVCSLPYSDQKHS